VGGGFGVGGQRWVVGLCCGCCGSGRFTIRTRSAHDYASHDKPSLFLEGSEAGSAPAVGGILLQTGEGELLAQDVQESSEVVKRQIAQSRVKVAKLRHGSIQYLKVCAINRFS